MPRNVNLQPCVKDKKIRERKSDKKLDHAVGTEEEQLWSEES